MGCPENFLLPREEVLDIEADRLDAPPRVGLEVERDLHAGVADPPQRVRRALDGPHVPRFVVRRVQVAEEDLLEEPPRVDALLLLRLAKVLV